MDWECLWSHNSGARQVDLSAFDPEYAADFGSDFNISSFASPFEDSCDVPSGPLYDFDFGENVLGVKNITDLRDLLAAKDKEFQVIHDAVQTTPTTSPPWGPNAYAAWHKDYLALLARWTPARTAAAAAIVAGGASKWDLLGNLLGGGVSDPSTQTGQPYYDNLLHAVQVIPRTTSSGDLDDLHARLNAVQAIPTYAVPQPTRDADQQMSLSHALRPYDPIGDAKAAENWKKDAFIAAAVLIGGMLLVATVKQKV